MVPNPGLLPNTEFVAVGVGPKTLLVLVPKPPKLVFVEPNKGLFSVVWGLPNKFVVPVVAPNKFEGCAGAPNKLLCCGPYKN